MNFQSSALKHRSATKMRETRISVTEVFDTFLGEIRGSQEGMRHLRECFAQTECPKIDYDRYAEDFAQLYFLQNLSKGEAVFSQELAYNSLKVLDLGCGSGATVAAFLCELDRRAQGSLISVSVVLVDRSIHQLRLARTLLERLRPALPALKIEVECCHKEIEYLNMPADTADAVLLGHVLNENRSTLENIIEKAVRIARPDATLCILERVNDPIWRQVQDALSSRGLPTARRDISYHGDALLGGERARVAKTGYASARIPTSKFIMDCIALYFEAWRSQRTDLLSQIFTESAIYAEKPFHQPLRGLRAIEDYWKRKVVPQRGLAVHLTRASYTGQMAFAEWSARFELDCTDVEVRGVLLVSGDLNEQRISRLDEYFRTTKCAK